MNLPSESQACWEPKKPMESSRTANPGLASVKNSHGANLTKSPTQQVPGRGQPPLSPVCWAPVALPSAACKSQLHDECWGRKGASGARKGSSSVRDAHTGPTPPGSEGGAPGPSMGSQSLSLSVPEAANTGQPLAKASWSVRRARHLAGCVQTHAAIPAEQGLLFQRLPPLTVTAERGRCI